MAVAVVALALPVRRFKTGSRVVPSRLGDRRSSCLVQERQRR